LADDGTWLPVKGSYLFPISNARILGLDDNQVSRSYRDYRDGQHKTLTLDFPEFIRRFLLHVLPKRLMRVRHYGLPGNLCRVQRLAQIRKLLAAPPPEPEPEAEQGHEAEPGWPCRWADVGACAQCAGLRRVERRWAAHPTADAPPTPRSLNLPTKSARAEPLPHSAHVTLRSRSCKQRIFRYNRPKPAPKWRPEGSR